jgi:hypothetical protein
VAVRYASQPSGVVPLLTCQFGLTNNWAKGFEKAK